MSSKLKPCPFCGGEVKLFRDNWDKCGAHCKECLATVGVHLSKGWRATFANREEAIAAWNRRANIGSYENDLIKSANDINVATNADRIRSMRLIDADALRDEVLHDNTYDNDTVNYYLGWIDDAPTIDVVPVVRCENCKHYNRTGCSEGFGWCERMDRGTNDYFYCSLAERNDRVDVEEDRKD